VNLGQTLNTARNTLAQADVEDAALEAEVLLRHVLHIERSHLYRDYLNEINPADSDTYFSFINRRLTGEPSAYITGIKEFYGLEFSVNSSVLIPRPETELLIETALSLVKKRGYGTIVDVGTGSGCITVCLALNLPKVKFYATDISDTALDIAAKNCRKHGVEDRVSFLKGDLLEPLPEPVDMVLANLPYVRREDVPGVNTFPFEPVSALDGGEEGLTWIRSLCHQLPGKLLNHGSVLLETGEGQAQTITALLGKIVPGGAIDVLFDYAGIGRLVQVCLPPDSRSES